MSSPTPAGVDSPSVPSSSSTPSTDGSALSQFRSLSPLQTAKRLRDGRVPCARNSLLIGIGTAAAVSVVGAVAGRGLKSSMNWGVGSFMFVSLASWQTCRSAVKAESTRMKVVIEDFNRKRSGESSGKGTQSGLGKTVDRAGQQ